MPAIETHFLDTNVLVKICEYFRIKDEGGDLKRFEQYYQFIQRLLNDGHRLFLNKLSVLEMYFLYHRWFYWSKKIEERAPFDEMFGRGATYELEDGERQKIEGIIDKFAKEMRELGIEFSKVDQSDVLYLAEVLYRRTRPSVEAYDLTIYANSILENAAYLVTDDGSLRRAIDNFRRKHGEEIRTEIVNSFGTDKYPYWARRHALPQARKPRL